MHCSHCMWQDVEKAFARPVAPLHSLFAHAHLVGYERWRKEPGVDVQRVSGLWRKLHHC